jgi:hypothetical protein
LVVKKYEPDHVLPPSVDFLSRVSLVPAMRSGLATTVHMEPSPAIARLWR